MRHDGPDGLIVRDSFALPYAGGMIWCEELDALGDHEDLVREKFDRELQAIARPSSPSRVALHLQNTLVSDALARRFAEGLTGAGQAVMRLAIVGLSGKSLRAMRAALAAVHPTFATAYFTDYEKAKGWLVRTDR